MGLFALAGAIVWVPEWRATLTLAAAVASGYLVSGLGWASLWAQVRPLLWVCVFLLPLQWVTQGWERAVVVVVGLVASVAAAGLLTCTTRVATLTDAVVRWAAPLRRFGVRPDRLGLAVGLAIRSVPVVLRSLEEVREARRARGAERRMAGLFVPVVVRTVRHAERVGDALAARGADD